MTNEAVLVLRTADPIDWIVGNTHPVPKGTVMMISGSSNIGRTAISGQGVAPAFAGIAHREKIANDGRTRLGLFRDGIFRMKFSGTAVAGEAVVISGCNTVGAWRGSASYSGSHVGIALETAADTETKEVWVGK